MLFGRDCDGRRAGVHDDDRRDVYALDDETLKALWSFNTGSFNSAPPMTYSVNGKQYVAVLIGGNVAPRAC